MMKTIWERQLLSQLLAKYEAIQLNLPASTGRRRVQLSLQNGDFLAYNLPDPSQKAKIHELLEELKEAALLDFVFVRSQTPKLVQRVWLNLDRIEAAYQRVNLLAPAKQAAPVLAQIKQLLQQESGLPNWIRSFLLEAAGVIETENQLAAPLPLQQKQALLLLQALAELAKISPERPYERSFSQQFFIDDKVYKEDVRPHLSHVLRDYLLPHLLAYPFAIAAELDLSDDELLSLAGASRQDEILQFSGPLLLARQNLQLDLGFFLTCASMSVTELPGLELVLPDQIRRIFLVENQLNFTWLAQRRSQNEDWQDMLLIHHGGCFSPQKGEFFQLLQKARQGQTQAAQIYFWGDIDLGGFLSFNRLAKSFFPDLTPWHMDQSDLVNQTGLAQPISKVYAGWLRQLQADEDFKVFWPVIAKAIQLGIRLEQGALLGQL